MFIAGSYSWPELHIRSADLDIFLPFVTEKVQRTAVLGLLVFLYERGYDIPIPIKYEDSEEVSLDEFRCIRRNISQILVFHTSGGRTVQLHVLRESVGRTATEAMEIFDLTLSHRFFDGRHLWSTRDNVYAMETRTIQVNTAMDHIDDRTFPEWVRTLRQILKCTQRKFVVHTNLADTLLTYVADSLARNGCIINGRINIEPFVHDWNALAGEIHWVNGTGPRIEPYVFPPGRSIADVGFLMRTDNATRRYIPLETRGMGDGDHIHWDGFEHLVESWMPFPTMSELTRRDVTPDTSGEVFDHVLMETRDIGEYLRENPRDQFIVCCPAGRASTLTRAQVAVAKVYLPCREVGSCDTGNVYLLHKAITTIALPTGTYYVPSVQVNEFLSLPGTGKVQLVDSGYSWACSKVFIHSREDLEDAQSFVGGYANNAGATSAKTIHYIRRLP